MIQSPSKACTFLLPEESEACNSETRYATCVTAWDRYVYASCSSLLVTGKCKVWPSSVYGYSASQLWTHQIILQRHLPEKSGRYTTGTVQCSCPLTCSRPSKLEVRCCAGSRLPESFSRCTPWDDTLKRSRAHTVNQIPAVEPCMHLRTENDRPCHASTAINFRSNRRTM